MTGQVGGRLAEIRERLAKITPGVWKLWGMQVLADQDGTGDVDTAVPVADTWCRDEHGKPRTFDAEFIRCAPADLAVTSDALLAVLALADEADALSRRIWDDMDDYADIGDPKGPYPDGMACVNVDRLRRAVAAHLDPKKEN